METTPLVQLDPPSSSLLFSDENPSLESIFDSYEYIKQKTIDEFVQNQKQPEESFTQSNHSQIGNRVSLQEKQPENSQQPFSNSLDHTQTSTLHVPPSTPTEDLKQVRN